MLVTFFRFVLHALDFGRQSHLSFGFDTCELFFSPGLGGRILKFQANRVQPDLLGECVNIEIDPRVVY